MTKQAYATLTGKFGIIFCEDCLSLIVVGDKVHSRNNGGTKIKNKEVKENIRIHYHIECWEKRMI